MRAGACLACVIVLGADLLLAEKKHVDVPPELLERVSRYVEDYYRRTQTIVAREKVLIQPLDYGLRPSGFNRTLEFELRIEWDPSSSSTVSPPMMTRTLQRSAGYVDQSRDASDCFDPHDASIEPMAVLLSSNRGEFVFSLSGTREKGRVALIDYVPVAEVPPSVEWNGLCASIELNSQTRGRIWVDIESGTVLRVEEWLKSPYQFVVPKLVHAPRGPVSQTIDRLETQIRYEAVKFTDPDETVMLPKSIRTLSVIENGGVPRLLKLQSFDRYRRFMTGGRIVK